MVLTYKHTREVTTHAHTHTQHILTHTHTLTHTQGARKMLRGNIHSHARTHAHTIITQPVFISYAYIYIHIHI